MSTLNLSDRASCAKPVNERAVPAHLICPSCLGILVNCHQTSAGIRLCQPCVVSKLHPKDFSTCPGSSDQNTESDRMANQETCTPDLATRRELLQLSVLCPNSADGCPEQLQWRFVERHLDENCQHEIVKCSRCLREIALCKLRSCHHDVQSADCCPFYVVISCPLCGDSSRSLNREEFVRHLNVCPEKVSDCKYACVGCTASMPRSQLSHHYAGCTDEHLEHAVMTVKQLGNETQLNNQRIRALEQTVTQLQNEAACNGAVARVTICEDAARAFGPVATIDSGMYMCGESVQSAAAVPADVPAGQPSLSSIEIARLEAGLRGAGKEAAFLREFQAGFATIVELAGITDCPARWLISQLAQDPQCRSLVRDALLNIGEAQLASGI